MISIILCLSFTSFQGRELSGGLQTYWQRLAAAHPTSPCDVVHCYSTTSCKRETSTFDADDRAQSCRDEP